MARALDKTLSDILAKYGETPKDACWDCHGTWVIYHKAIERMAARAGIKFDLPVVIEAKSADRIVAICVAGTMEDRKEWSIGEAAPGNNKNAYPYAMAEKRAKDRVVLKLLGLHGLAYSEDESDDFKDTAGAPSASRGAVADPSPKATAPTITADQAAVIEAVRVALTKCELATDVAELRQNTGPAAKKAGVTQGSLAASTLGKMFADRLAELEAAEGWQEAAE